MGVLSVFVSAKIYVYFGTNMGDEKIKRVLALQMERWKVTPCFKLGNQLWRMTDFGCLLSISVQTV